MTNTPMNVTSDAIVTTSPLPISCKLCNGHIHTDGDFRICMQCGQERITSEYWRLKMK